LADQREDIDVLVGLSVGTQAAAVAATTTLVRRLILISPTVDPIRRTKTRLLAAWAASGRFEEPALLRRQLPEWRNAGLSALRQGMVSAMALHLEAVLPTVRAALTIVHAECDGLTTHAYANQLAQAHGGRLVVVPGASHSWPYQDERRFVRVMEDALT
jgi:pimeloyl-ACP methyl ester carboxylesterase